MPKCPLPSPVTSRTECNIVKVIRWTRWSRGSGEKKEKKIPGSSLPFIPKQRGRWRWTRAGFMKQPSLSTPPQQRPATQLRLVLWWDKDWQVCKCVWCAIIPECVPQQAGIMPNILDFMWVVVAVCLIGTSLLPASVQDREKCSCWGGSPCSTEVG